MKKIFLLMLVAIVSLGASAQKSKAKGPQKEKVTFSVAMDCESCKAAIEKSIPFEKGVRDLEVDFAAGKVSVTFDPSKTSKANLIKALNSLKDIKVTETANCCTEKKECSADKKACCTEKKECSADKKTCCTEKKECPADKKACCTEKKECPADKKACCTEKKECPADKKCDNKKDCPKK